jgi:hypothetical protein
LGVPVDVAHALADAPVADALAAVALAAVALVEVDSVAVGEVDGAKWRTVSTDREAQVPDNGNRGPTVRIRRTGVTGRDLVLTDEFLSRKGSVPRRELEAVLVRFVAPVLKEEVTRSLRRISQESGECTTDITDGADAGKDADECV